MEKNKKDKLGIGYKIILIMQYILFGLIYLVFRCSCGHPYINIIPVIIFFIIQYVLLKYLKKELPLYQILWIFLSIPLLVVVIILTRNDMEKFHRIESESLKRSYYEAETNETIDPLSTRSLDLSK